VDISNELYAIGKLAKLVGISADTLRYYDEIGLLTPAHTSAETGYRYYTPAQAKDLAQIMELKAFDFPLAEIKQILQQGTMFGTPDIFRQRYGALVQEKQRISAAMEKLAQKLQSHEEELTMNKTILLVDDAAFMRMMCNDIFTKNGFTVVGEAEDGEQAVEMYKQFSPDLTIMNIVMPNMDGIDAVQKIRSYAPAARVIMLSALGQATMVANALLAGARRFVAKPFQLDTLLDAAKSTLREDEIPFNRETLAAILRAEELNAHLPNRKEVRSQAEIDEITTLAQAPNPDPAALDNLLERLCLLPHDLPAPTDDESFAATERVITRMNQQLSEKNAPDPVLKTLERLAEGQEKMTALLEKLLAQKG